MGLVYNTGERYIRNIRLPNCTHSTLQFIIIIVIKNLKWTNAKALQSLYNNLGKEWGDITCRKMKLKRWVLSLCLNVDSVADDVTSDGRLFQGFAAATQNARSPTVWRRVCGTARSADDAERKRCRPGRSATCCRLSVRCVGARPFRHRNASTASLNDIRSILVSWWRC